MQGAVNLDDYKVFKPAPGRSSLTPIVRKSPSAQQIRMIHAGAEGGTTKRLPTARTECAAVALTDAEIPSLARVAVTIEQHHGVPVDMDWPRHGETGEPFRVQAHPATVQSLPGPA